MNNFPKQLPMLKPLKEPQTPLYLTVKIMIDLEYDSKDEWVERDLEEEDGRFLHYTIIFTTLYYKSTLN